MKIPSFRVGCIIDGERTVITTRENEYFKIEIVLRARDSERALCQGGVRADPCGCRF